MKALGKICEKTIVSESRLNWLSSIFNKHYKGGEVIDLGCANGFMANEIEANNYIGLDTWEDAMNEAKINYPKHSFILTDASDFKIRKSTKVLIELGANTVIGGFGKDKVHDQFMKQGELVIIEQPTFYTMTRLSDLIYKYQKNGFKIVDVQLNEFDDISAKQRIIFVLKK
jgi:ribosomal protein L11 methylase PrmA